MSSSMGKEQEHFGPFFPPLELVVMVKSALVRYEILTFRYSKSISYSKLTFRDDI